MRMFKRGDEGDEESMTEPEEENIHGLDKRDPWKMRMFKKEQPWKMRMFKRYPYYDKKSPWKMRMFKRMSTGFGNATYFQRIIFLVSLLAFIRNFDWDYLYSICEIFPGKRPDKWQMRMFKRDPEANQ